MNICVRSVDKYVVYDKKKRNYKLKVVVPVGSLVDVHCNQKSTGNEDGEFDGWLLRLIVILNNMTCCYHIPHCECLRYHMVD